MSVRASGVAEFKPYAVEYRYGGRLWSFDLLAESHEDAEQRVAALGWAKVSGEIIERLPASVPLWYVRLRCWWASRLP